MVSERDKNKGTLADESLCHGEAYASWYGSDINAVPKFILSELSLWMDGRIVLFY